MNSKTDLRRASDPNRDRKGAASTALRPLPHGRGSARSAFTLVELLVVIVVIGLLISILVPAVNAIRLKARETTTQGTLGTLDTAIETFKADGRVGGGYPPSRSDNPVIPTQGGLQVASPYVDGETPEISGAGLLVWTLAGADLLGCPGFRVFRTGASSLWSQDTDANPGTNDRPDLSGAYALSSSGRQPIQARSGPFVDLSTMRVSRANPASGQLRFVIETEVEAREEMNHVQSLAQRNYPVFLDSFGFPILYWRADPAGLRVADTSPQNNNSPQDRGIYHFKDNWPLIDSRYAEHADHTALVLRPGDERHRLVDMGNKPPLHGSGGGGGGVYPQGTFPGYIQNLNIQARPTPHNPNTYLLISPGNDGLYGTADDIANFEHNGADDTGD